MDVQTILLKLKDWFKDYTSGFYSDEPMVQQNMMLKVEHTRRVCEAILMIGAAWIYPAKIFLLLKHVRFCMISADSSNTNDTGRF